LACTLVDVSWSCVVLAIVVAIAGRTEPAAQSRVARRAEVRAPLPAAPASATQRLDLSTTNARGHTSPSRAAPPPRRFVVEGPRRMCVVVDPTFRASIVDIRLVTLHGARAPPIA
jgi:hypothetical protein